MLIIKGKYRGTRNNFIQIFCLFCACLLYSLYGYDPSVSLEAFSNVFLFQGNRRDLTIAFFLYACIFTEVALLYWLTRVASFRCPLCTMIIDANIDWTCAYCGKKHHTPLWYTILHRCSPKWFSKCGLEPEAFQCPHCKETIPLTTEAQKKPERKPNEKLVAKKPEPPTPKPASSSPPRAEHDFM